MPATVVTDPVLTTAVPTHAAPQPATAGDAACCLTEIRSLAVATEEDVPELHFFRDGQMSRLPKRKSSGSCSLAGRSWSVNWAPKKTPYRSWSEQAPDQDLATKEDVIRDLSLGKQALEQELVSARVRVAEWELQSPEVTTCNWHHLHHRPLKSHPRDLDSGLLDRNFKCATLADRDNILESIVDLASWFVATCGFTIELPSEDD
jgi:hypothetical protein